MSGLLQRLTLAALATALSVAAIDISKLQPQGYVSDFAQVVDARSKAELERYATLVKERTGAEMAFVTVATLDGDPIEDTANKLYEQWGIGAKTSNEGTLLLLAINDRRSRLEVGYGLEPLLPDGFAGSVLREMRPALREQDYGDAFIAAAATIGSRIAQAKGVTLDGEPQPSRQRSGEGGIPPILIIFGIIAVILLISAISNNKRGGPRSGGGMGPIWYGGYPGSHGRWPRSGGGFGGYDSGGGGFGGFGGFGGGHSGGGGASGSW